MTSYMEDQGENLKTKTKRPLHSALEGAVISSHYPKAEKKEKMRSFSLSHLIIKLTTFKYLKKGVDKSEKK